jgi:hypothetical protein
MTIPPSTSGWTFANIESKIRAMTGTPSTDQLSTAQIAAYVNNYLAYTMPHELKVQIQNKFLSFKTTPGVNVYTFPGAYLTDSPGAYADGFPLIFYEDPDVFYQDWPLQYAVDQVATGDGMTTTFVGQTQGFPVQIGSFFITDGLQVLQDIGFTPLTATIATGSGVTAYAGTLAAIPVSVGSFSVSTPQESFSDNSNGTLTGTAGGSGTLDYTSGAWTLTFNVALPTATPIEATYNVVGLGALSGNGSGTINYYTGAFSATFTSAPLSTDVIYDKFISYQGNRPQGVMFFQNQFTLMPVPDQVYQIQMQGFIFPQQLVNATDTPAQQEWGPLIAYGASIEIFMDRGDTVNAEKYLPYLKRQEAVALSRTIAQYTPMQSLPRF